MSIQTEIERLENAKSALKTSITNKGVIVDEGKKLNEICTELNKTPKQIFNHLTLLKNKGYLFNRKY